MNNYIVSGWVEVEFSLTVHAENEDEAAELVYTGFSEDPLEWATSEEIYVTNVEIREYNA